MRRLDNIDLRLLRVFVALAEAGSFGAAQIALNLSQPTLSTHLAALEDSLGGKLCQRGRSGFRLTPLGETTVEAARRLFADIDRFQQRVGAATGQLVGRLRIGIVDGVVSNPRLGLQGALAGLMARSDRVFVDLELGTPHDLEQAVVEGRRDIAIGPFAQRGPGVTYVPLDREIQGLYCGRGHRLFDAARVDRAAIRDSLFSVRAYRQLDDLYRVDHPRANASVRHMEAQVMLILSGRFIGFLPCHIGDDWVERGQMRALRPQATQYPSEHFAAFRTAEADHPLLAACLSEITKVARA